MRFSNIVFYVYFIKFHKIKVNCLELLLYWAIFYMKNRFTLTHFNLCLAICQYQPCIPCNVQSGGVPILMVSWCLPNQNNHRKFHPNLPIYNRAKSEIFVDLKFPKLMWRRYYTYIKTLEKLKKKDICWWAKS